MHCRVCKLRVDEGVVCCFLKVCAFTCIARRSLWLDTTPFQMEKVVTETMHCMIEDAYE
jgi:hypothetical protein